MSSAELEGRVNRLYAALEGLREEDLTKFPPKVIDAEGSVHVWQDFRGGATDADLANAAHALIHNVAHIEDHIKGWAKRTGVDSSEALAALRQSQAFLIMKDLSNLDKHGPPRDGGHSGLSPRVEEFNRILQLATKAEKGSTVGIVMTDQGMKQVGDGTSQVVITGDVLDADGNKIGDLHELALEAVDAVEALFESLGIRAR